MLGYVEVAEERLEEASDMNPKDSSVFNAMELNGGSEFMKDNDIYMNRPITCILFLCFAFFCWLFIFSLMHACKLIKLP